MIRKGAALAGLVLMSPVIAQPVMVEAGVFTCADNWSMAAALSPQKARICAY